MIILSGMTTKNATMELTLMNSLMPVYALLMTKVRALLIMVMIVPILNGSKNITSNMMHGPIWLNIVQMHQMKLNAKNPTFIVTSQKVVLKTTRNVTE